MEILFWILFGALAGWIASVIMRTNSNQGIIMDIFLGIAGALVGGFIFDLFGAPGISGFNIWSLLVAVIGAAVLIYLGRLLRRSA
ncbi:hypothetical protein A3D05_01105 [Candidatus Gottesmanbacteria bacterium RIFCSPHIGHO2_02_FULL_40_24]|uniref:Transglycosylase n=1 Tax=Candidatus Gottesmanbacteria bacterium RIFCSPHIGHO2_01_FULL_40_15 TaxID=1798376 RepID=A0A1F5Z5T8_9BACT|nr:MAG: hypothetical protein A2777_02765 [Candidatus Gottesmanbacteria bacterium RIFCSPHIGHO2_01_FULL_40_15]OGG18333.1 MAG: hypothetical protein A3D05_01105 [Candidatus Gottesmanbacteria bacterium RIFCSPHIGHO2_02_FULL_40_24]OGG21336.1 MAG: hypothetical protein A3B48_02390 [Candidatus Gottesmanbacteria bacterium RIFCSPLOWO2_01_FULL_40_10]OGG25989.1 MAG: hypothetical protein A3E42_02340 [Candidatus Gottesmanbacteria bacterium RIFCSPHIGHO2_12_FULL_40_13]OGG32125.1 MAG: hypothetical protein A3I80_0